MWYVWPILFALGGASASSQAMPTCTKIISEFSPIPSRIVLQKKLVDIGIVIDSRSRTLDTAQINRGAFNAAEFTSVWDPIQSYAPGQLYGQLLLRWAERIDQLHSKEIGDVFFTSVANRFTAENELGTVTFPSLPSIDDMMKSIREAHGMPRVKWEDEVERRMQERVLIGLAACRKQLEASQHPIDQVSKFLQKRAGADALPPQSPFSQTFILPDFSVVLRQDDFHGPTPYLLVNLIGQILYDDPLTRRASWTMLADSDGAGTIGGALYIDKATAKEMLADIKHIEEAFEN